MRDSIKAQNGRDEKGKRAMSAGGKRQKEEGSAGLNPFLHEGVGLKTRESLTGVEG